MTITHDQGRDQKISGTYLVTYSNKVVLNGTWFVNQLGSSIRKPAVSAMVIVNITAHKNLPFLHELSLSNLHHIGTLREELTLGSFLSKSFALLAAFLLCSTVWVSYKYPRARARTSPRTDNEVERADPRDVDHLKEGGVSAGSSHGAKLPSCRPYPVACTRIEEKADRALRVQMPVARLEHSQRVIATGRDKNADPAPWRQRCRKTKASSCSWIGVSD